MDQTSRMIALLGRIRREMNGFIAERMATRREKYGLNYGVSSYRARQHSKAVLQHHWQ